MGFATLSDSGRLKALGLKNDCPLSNLGIAATRQALYLVPALASISRVFDMAARITHISHIVSFLY